MGDTAREILDLASTDESRRSPARAALQQKGLTVLPDLIAAFRKGQLSEYACAEVIAGMNASSYTQAISIDAKVARSLIPKLAECLPPQEALALIAKHLDPRDGSDRVMGACCAIGTLRRRAEEEGRDPRPMLQPVLPAVIALFGHPDEYTRAPAYQCIARLDPALVLPALSATLLRLHAAGARGFHDVVSAIAAHGPEAASAVPALHEVLRTDSYHNNVSACCDALVAIGMVSAESIPLMEAARDRVPFKVKSDEKSFRGHVNRAIKALNARKPAPGRAAASPQQTYLLDLLHRMGGLESYATSSDADRRAARGEAETLADPALIEELAALMQRKLKAPELCEAVVVLGFLTRSTRSARGKVLICELLGRPKLHDLVVALAIHAAAQCEMVEVLPFVRRRLLEKHDLAALDYIQTLKLRECVEDVVAYMNARRDNVESGLRALVAIGSPEVVPHLLHYARHPFESRKQDEVWWRIIAIDGLGEVGDHNAMVDELLSLIELWPDWQGHIADALVTRGDPRACDAVVRALGFSIAQYAANGEHIGAQGHWLVRKLEWIRALGRHREAATIALVRRLSEPELWKLLRGEDQAFIAAYFENAPPSTPSATS